MVKKGTWVPHFVLLALIWGSSFLFIKVAVTQLHPLHVALLRVALGALTLVIIIYATGRRLPTDLRLWGHLAVIALLGNALPFSLFAYGEQHVSSGLAGIWNATTPLTSMLVLAWIFRVESLTRTRVFGLLTGFLGVLVVLGVWAGVGAGSLVGQVMCFAAATSYAFVGPLMKRLTSTGQQAGVVLAGSQMLMATVELAIVAPLVAGLPPTPNTLSLKTIAAIVALGALGSGIAFVLSYRVINLAGVSTTVTVTYLMPIVAVAAGVIVLKEHLSWNQPVGALIVLLGVAVTQSVPARLLQRLRRDRVESQEFGKVLS
jgi:drug/metabolite transporter (DMT)-like permease